MYTEIRSASELDIWSPKVAQELCKINRDYHAGGLTSKIMQIVADNARFCFFSLDAGVEGAPLIGYLVATHLDKLKCVHIEYVCVKKGRKYRRMGQGTALMMKVFEVAQANQCFVTLDYKFTKKKLFNFYQRFNPIREDVTPWWGRVFMPQMHTPLFYPEISLKKNMSQRQRKMIALEPLPAWSSQVEHGILKHNQNEALFLAVKINLLLVVLFSLAYFFDGRGAE